MLALTTSFQLSFSSSDASIASSSLDSYPYSLETHKGGLSTHYHSLNLAYLLLGQVLSTWFVPLPFGLMAYPTFLVGNQ